MEGRRFTPGTRRSTSAVSRVGRFDGLALGSDVKFGGTTWNVVGVFAADDAAFESEVWGDIDLMMPAFQRDGYQSVTVQAGRSARCSTRSQAAIAGDPRLYLQAAARAGLLRGAVARR